MDLSTSGIEVLNKERKICRKHPNKKTRWKQPALDSIFIEEHTVPRGARCKIRSRLLGLATTTQRAMEHTRRIDSATAADQSTTNWNAKMPVACPRQPSSSATSSRNISKVLRDLIRGHQWDACLQEIEACPEVAREGTIMYYQGEKISVSYLHLAVYESAPEAVIESLICCHPQALDLPDSKGGRYPMHFAAMRNKTTVQLLAAARPETLLALDYCQQLPLHYAVQYACTDTIEFLLDKCPQAASYKTSRARTPLHILSSLRADTESKLPLRVFQKIVECYPEALQMVDLQGKVPLHLVSGQPFPRWEILQFLSDCYPAALLLKTNDGLTPVDCSRTFKDTQDVVYSLLLDKTHEYRRCIGQFHFRLKRFKRKKVDLFQLAYG